MSQSAQDSWQMYLTSGALVHDVCIWSYCDHGKNIKCWSFSVNLKFIMNLVGKGRSKLTWGSWRKVGKQKWYKLWQYCIDLYQLEFLFMFYQLTEDSYEIYFDWLIQWSKQKILNVIFVELTMLREVASLQLW